LRPAFSGKAKDPTRRRLRTKLQRCPAPVVIGIKAWIVLGEFEQSLFGLGRGSMRKSRDHLV
jgi:hypothetical protein